MTKNMFCLFALIFFVEGCAFDTRPENPPEFVWVRVNRTFMDARFACEDQGMQLPVLDTAFKSLLFREYVAEKCSDVMCTAGFWIGIEPSETGSFQYWLDGQFIIDTDWAFGEPFTERDTEVAVAMVSDQGWPAGETIEGYPSGAPGWATFPVGSLHNVACER